MARVVVTALVLLLLVACSGRGEDESRPVVEARPPAAKADAVEAPAVAARVRLARLPDSREGDSAALTGTLRAEEGCLYVVADGGERYLLASTIPGASWDVAGQALVVTPPGESSEPTRYRVGERVTLGGSEGDASVLDELWVEAPAAACRSDRIWVTHTVS